MVFSKKILFAALLLLSTGLVAGEKEIRESLSEAIPGIAIERVKASDIEGLFVVEASGQVLYSNATGSHFVIGDMFSTEGGKLSNLSEQARNESRAASIAAVSQKDRIVFAPEGEVKARIAVFTDIDCGYCRKLHKEIPRLNELGIEVSYLAYPRAGIGSNSYLKIVSAWCAEDPQQALTDAKLGKVIPKKSCENPVASQFQLAQTLGVNGTPAIILEDGTLLPGYMEADKLAKGLGIL